MRSFAKRPAERPAGSSVMQNNRIEHFQNVKNNSMKNRKINVGDPYDSVHSQRSTTSARCQLFVANELNRGDNRTEVHKMNGLGGDWLGRRGQTESGKNRLLIGGNEMATATDGYVTAEDESAGDEPKSNAINAGSASFLRHKFPAHKYKVRAYTKANV